MFKEKINMKQNITISSEDAEFIEFAFSLVNTSRYPSFTKVTEVYNRVFNKQLSSTSCGACIRQRILELKATLDKINEEILKEEETETITDIPYNTENQTNNEIKNGGAIKKESKEVEEKSEEDQGVEEAEQLKEKKLKRGRPSKNNQGSAS